MGTYALGAHLMEQRNDINASSANGLIRDMRNSGRLHALPIMGTDKETGELIAKDGTRLREYGQPGSGRWVPTGPLTDGTVRYLGSASHAGHIELKALWVSQNGLWHNIITMQPEDRVI